MTASRNKWIDALKFIGIFEIYLGHFATDAGRAYVFVFTHHVALFFFISGYLENYNKDGTIKTIVKRFKGIMIPFYFFGLLSIIYFTVQNNMPLNLVYDNCIDLLQGAIRNKIIAGSPWFLSALFIVEVLFQLIKKVRFKSLML